MLQGSHNDRGRDRGYANLPQYGYPVGVGPLEYYARSLKRSWIFLSLINSFIHVYFEAARDVEYLKVCGGSLPPRPVPGKVSELECRLQRRGEAAWKVMQYDTKALDNRRRPDTLRSDDILGEPHPPADPAAATIVKTCAWTPPGEYVGHGTYRVMNEFVVAARDADGNAITRFRYEVTDYVFLEATKPTEADPSAPTYETGPMDDNDPRPFLLGAKEGDSRDEAKLQLRYLAVAYRTQKNMVAPSYFISPLGEYRLTYAQARVYNPTAEDTFTQDWRV